MTIRKPGVIRRTDGPTLPEFPTSAGGTDRAGGSPLADDPLQPVFVSPRVVDQRAFDDLSGRLRLLIDQAVDRQQELRASLERAAATAEGFKAAELSQQTSLEVAGRAVVRVEERVREAERLLDRTAQIAEATDEFSRRADEIIAQKLAAFDEAVALKLAELERRSSAVEARLAEASATLERKLDAVRDDADNILTPNIAVLNAACDRAARVLGRSETGELTPDSLADVVSRAEAVQKSTAGAASDLREIADRAEKTRVTMGDWINTMTDLVDKLDKERNAIATHASRMIDEADEALKSAETRVQRLATSGDEALEAIRPRLDEATSELRGLIEESKDTHKTSAMALRVTESALDRLRDLLATLEPWKSLVTSTGETDPRALPAPLQKLLDAVRDELRQDLGRIGEALRVAAARTESAVDDAHAEVVVRGLPKGVTTPE
jgi:hypothetical protein